MDSCNGSDGATTRGSQLPGWDFISQAISDAVQCVSNQDLCPDVCHEESVKETNYESDLETAESEGSQSLDTSVLVGVPFHNATPPGKDETLKRDAESPESAVFNEEASSPTHGETLPEASYAAKRYSIGRRNRCCSWKAIIVILFLLGCMTPIILEIVRQAQNHYKQRTSIPSAALRPGEPTKDNPQTGSGELEEMHNSSSTESIIPSASHEDYNSTEGNSSATALEHVVHPDEDLGLNSTLSTKNNTTEDSPSIDMKDEGGPLNQTESSSSIAIDTSLGTVDEETSTTSEASKNSTVAPEEIDSTNATAIVNSSTSEHMTNLTQTVDLPSLSDLNSVEPSNSNTTVEKDSLSSNPSTTFPAIKEAHNSDNLSEPNGAGIVEVNTTDHLPQDMNDMSPTIVNISTEFNKTGMEFNSTVGITDSSNSDQATNRTASANLHISYGLNDTVVSGNHSTDTDSSPTFDAPANSTTSSDEGITDSSNSDQATSLTAFANLHISDWLNDTVVSGNHSTDTDSSPTFDAQANSTTSSDEDQLTESNSTVTKNFEISTELTTKIEIASPKDDVNSSGVDTDEEEGQNTSSEVESSVLPAKKITYFPGDLTKKENGLALSSGLKTTIVAVSGEKVRYKDGSKSSIAFHDRPDGAATFASENGAHIYVSNSEKTNRRGGVGAITFEGCKVTNYTMILTKTTRNCSGGKSPWGTFISCEENKDEGQCWETDPLGINEARKTVLGGEGGSFESVACDDRDPSSPAFFVTNDMVDGEIRRFTPDKATMAAAMNTGDFWSVLSTPGTMEYLVIQPDQSPDGSSDVESGNFFWTGSLKDGKKSAEKHFRECEGIDAKNGTLFFVCKDEKEIFTLNLDDFTYKKASTKEGKFNGEPDQVYYVLGENKQALYFTEEASGRPGIHARDRSNNLLTIVEDVDWLGGGGTSGFAFSPDMKYMYFALQNDGVLFCVEREDGYPFDGRAMDLVYHPISSRSRRQGGS